MPGQRAHPNTSFLPGRGTSPPSINPFPQHAARHRLFIPLPAAARAFLLPKSFYAHHHMTTAPTHQDTDRDELVRLAGEQTLLKQENATLTAAQQRDLQALRNLVSNLTLNPDWHARGTSLLNRIQQREIQTALNAQRLTALAQLTGIS